MTVVFAAQKLTLLTLSERLRRTGARLQHKRQAYWKEYNTRPGVREKKSAYTREWRREVKKDPEKYADYLERKNVWRRRWRKNPDVWATRAVRNARQRARQRELPFNISASDLELPPVCPVLGTEWTFGTGYTDPRIPTLDRVKPELGYVVGNVRVISLRANSLRSDASAAELRAVAAYAAELEGV